jgi:hypothetical protein
MKKIESLTPAMHAVRTAALYGAARSQGIALANDMNNLQPGSICLPTIPSSAPRCPSRN